MPAVPHQIGQIHCQVGPVGKIAVLIEDHDEALQGGEVHLPQFEDVVFTELVPEGFEPRRVPVVEVRQELERGFGVVRVDVAQSGDLHQLE